MIHQTKPFKLPPIADSKAYLNLSSIIQYYLCCPEFSTQCSDDALITSSQNAECRRETDVCSIDTLLSYGLLLVHVICSISIMCNVWRTF